MYILNKEATSANSNTFHFIPSVFKKTKAKKDFMLHYIITVGPKGMDYHGSWALQFTSIWPFLKMSLTHIQKEPFTPIKLHSFY